MLILTNVKSTNATLAHFLVAAGAELPPRGLLRVKRLREFANGESRLAAEGDGAGS